MSTVTFQTVYMSGTQAEADIVIGLLRSAGLHPLELQTSPHVGFAGAEVGYRVEVPKRELDEAREVLSTGNRGENPGAP